MKWVVRVSAGIVALVVAAAALAAGLPWLPVAGERLNAGPYRAHLEANEVVLDLGAPDAGLKLAPEHLDARYIVLGEMHGYALPQRLDAALVAYLQAEGPARWYLAEMTPREAMAANEYVSGGDEAYLRAVFDRFAAMEAQWGNNEFFDKFAAIRTLNEGLPAERRVRFIGIDEDREGEPLAVPAFEAAEPDLGDPSTAQALNAALLAVTADKAGRYRAMDARLAALAATPGFAEARFMGLWGTFHASEAKINGATPFSLWLQEEGRPYAGEVVTINTLCAGDCFNMMPAGALPGPLNGPDGETYTYLPLSFDNPYFQRPKGISDFSAALGDDRAALYRIGGEGSPYAEGDRLSGSSGYLTMAQRWSVDGAGADMTDYVLFFRGTPPLTPWAGEAFDITGEAAASLP